MQDKKATARVVSYVLNYIVLRSKLKGANLFINLSNDAFLDSEIISIIPKNDFILELKGDIKITDEIVTAAKNYKNNGYLISIDNLNENEESFCNLSLLDGCIDFFKIDILKTSNEKIAQIISRFKKNGTKVIIEKIETEREYEICKAYGADYFQGYFFQKPNITAVSNLNPKLKNTFELVRLLEKEAETNVIVEAFSCYPDLTINLLQFVNSAGMATKNKISSISQAINFIGRKALKNWLMLLMYTDGSINNFSSALLESSLLRAKVMELLAELISNKDFAQKAFLVGILSNLDALFKVNIENILQETNFEDDIKEALISYKGILGELLLISKENERGNFKDTIKLLLKFKIEIKEFAKIITESISWTTKHFYDLKS